MSLVPRIKICYSIVVVLAGVIIVKPKCSPGIFASKNKKLLDSVHSLGIVIAVEVIITQIEPGKV
jgi:hypothetical protein